MNGFFNELKVQRWDDHRYYHHSKVNQSLHFVSATSFLVAYVVAFSDPAMAALIGWLVAMTSRQVGHLFFEPRGYDQINQATDEYKEEIKVGYNIKRKLVLLAVWAASPLLLVADPTLLGMFAPHAGTGRADHPCRRAVAGGRPRRHRLPLGPAVHPEGHPHRPGVGDQDRHRPVPRHQALPPRAARAVAGPALDHVLDEVLGDEIVEPVAVEASKSGV